MKNKFTLAAAIALLLLGAYFGTSLVAAQMIVIPSTSAATTATSVAAYAAQEQNNTSSRTAKHVTPTPANPPGAKPAATAQGKATPSVTTTSKAPETAPPIPADFKPELQLRVTKLAENPPSDINLAKALINNKIYGCPAGSVTFIQLIAPAKLPPGEPSRDYKSLFAVTPGQLLQADGSHNFHLFCAEVKEQ